MKKQRTGPLGLWGTQAEDRTPQSTGDSIRGHRGLLNLQGDPSRAQASGSWAACQAWCSIPPLAQLLPLQLSDHTLLMTGCGHTRLVNHLPGLRTLRYQRSPATTAVISEGPADSTWRRSLGLWPPLGLTACRQPSASAGSKPQSLLGPLGPHIHLPCQEWLGSLETSCQF